MVLWELLKALRLLSIASSFVFLEGEFTYLSCLQLLSQNISAELVRFRMEKVLEKFNEGYWLSYGSM